MTASVRHWKDPGSGAGAAWRLKGGGDTLLTEFKAEFMLPGELC